VKVGQCCHENIQTRAAFLKSHYVDVLALQSLLSRPSNGGFPPTGIPMGNTMFMTAIFPPAETRPGFVRCSEQEFARASLAARRFRLGVLAQVHTHPGSVTLHSVGDDDMVRPRYEGMISIVVPHYARFGLRPLHGLGVHQLQDGIWVRIDAASIRERIILVPGGVDLR